MKNIRLPKSKLYRQWAAGLSLLIILSLMLPFSRALAVAGQVDANNVTSAPTIDGNLNEAGWNLANSASKATIGTPNNTVTFGAMWDATNLYIAVKVLDGNLSTTQPTLGKMTALKSTSTPTITWAQPTTRSTGSLSKATMTPPWAASAVRQACNMPGQQLQAATAPKWPFRGVTWGFTCFGSDNWL